MQAAIIGLERSAAPQRVSWTRQAPRVLRALLLALDRLVPPSGPRRNPELPTEWFKYPPI